MSGIKVNSSEYKQWVKHRNIKNLNRRTKKKNAVKAERTRQIKHNTVVKELPRYNLKTKSVDFKAPLNFSFIENMEETVSFFNDIIAFITNKLNFGKRLYIDISKIEKLTIDSLMYLLAIVNNLNYKFEKRFSFSGNAPANPGIKKMFSESGFYSFVNYTGSEPITKNADTLQIVSGQHSDNAIARRICDFMIEKSGLSKTDCRFLYVMMIELMSNTFKHAYKKDCILYPRWYCFAEYKKEEDKIAFTFMDTGDGIPSTVRKNFKEKLDLFGLNGEDKYVVSALKGDFRTATEKTYRGKGLPKIREFCTMNKIQDMHIITNRADVSVLKDDYDSKENTQILPGTLYYWTIKLDNLRG